MELAALAADPALGVCGMMRQFISPEIPPEKHAAIRPAVEVAGRVAYLHAHSTPRVRLDREFRPNLPGNFVHRMARPREADGTQESHARPDYRHRRLHLQNYGRSRTELAWQDQFSKLSVKLHKCIELKLGG